MRYADVGLYYSMNDRDVGTRAMSEDMQNGQGAALVRLRQVDTHSHFVNRNVADLVRVTRPVGEEENITSSESRLHGFAMDVPKHSNQKLALADESVNGYDSREHDDYR